MSTVPAISKEGSVETTSVPRQLSHPQPRHIRKQTDSMHQGGLVCVLCMFYSTTLAGRTSAGPNDLDLSTQSLKHHSLPKPLLHSLFTSSQLLPAIQDLGGFYSLASLIHTPSGWPWVCLFMIRWTANYLFVCLLACLFKTNNLFSFSYQSKFLWPMAPYGSHNWM